MGWLQSKTEVLIHLKDNPENPYAALIPKKYPINVTITHGPITIDNGTWKLAYANIKYAIKIPYVENNPLVINALFSLFSNNIATTYHINKIQMPGMMNWDGLNGEIITSNNGMNRFVSTLNIGELASNNTDMTFKLYPVQVYNEATIDFNKHVMSGKFNMISNGFSLTTGSDKTYAMKKFLFTSSDSIENNLLQYQSSLNISQLTLPLSQEFSLDNFLFSSKLSNLNFTLPKRINFETPSFNSLPSHIKPSSNIELKVGFDTTAGRTDASIIATDIAFPDNIDSKDTTQYPSKYTVKIKSHIPKKTAETLLANYIHSEDMIKSAKSMMNPDKSSASNDDDSLKPEADYLLKQLVLRGFLISENNHYSLSV